MRSAFSTDLVTLQMADPLNGTDYGYSESQLNALREASYSSDHQAQPEAALRPTRRSRKRLGAAAAIAGVLVIAAVTNSVLWPHNSATLMAYGITTSPDGAVTIQLSWAELTDVNQAERALRTAKVPAVVIRERPDCHNTIDPEGDNNLEAIDNAITYSAPRGVITVQPAKIPRGAFVVFGIPPIHNKYGPIDFFMTTTPPTCMVAQ